MYIYIFCMSTQVKEERGFKLVTSILLGVIYSRLNYSLETIISYLSMKVNAYLVVAPPIEQPNRQIVGYFLSFFLFFLKITFTQH
jgi:hypothetical protein